MATASAELCVAAAIVVTFTVVATPAASAPESAKARLTFVRNASVFVASVDGRNAAVQLRAERGRGSQRFYSEPAWSPRGDKLAASRTNEPSSGSEMHPWVDIVVRRGARPPVSRLCLCWSASWSPDGRRLVYVDNETELAIIDDARLNGPSRVIFRADVVDDLVATPAWSPDGNLIAFVRGGFSDLYVIAPNGRGRRRLTTGEALNPSWSPDGRSIVFDDGRRIRVIGRRGGAVRFVATGTDPAWSPDGTTIAFVKNRNIWLVDRNGRRPRLFARNATQPAWRPSL
jgi:Tol biopolymer transport system component